MKWLVNSIKWVRDLFPFTHEGRQTLIYMMYAWSVVVLTAVASRILTTTAENNQWGIYASVANAISNSLLIGVIGFACFVSIRAIKLGKDGLDVQSRNNGDDTQQSVTATTKTEVKSGSSPLDPD